MEHKQPGQLRKLWWLIKYAVTSFFEWQNAKEWAKIFHPSWAQMATKCRNAETKQYYKNKILYEYRISDYGEE